MSWYLTEPDIGLGDMVDTIVFACLSSYEHFCVVWIDERYGRSFVLHHSSWSALKVH